ncbi:MAG: arsenate reductase (glutaredoxin) [Pseudomonadota bacterium]
MSLTIYHNPRCSKSRKTLEILQESAVDHTIVEYLKSPPSAARIMTLAGLLGLSVAEIVRQGESVFREATDLPNLDDDAALAAWVAANPSVLQRPIVVDDDKGRAVVGRPPESVADLIRS